MDRTKTYEMWIGVPEKKPSRKSTLVGLQAADPGTPKSARTKTIIGLNADLPGGKPSAAMAVPKLESAKSGAAKETLIGWGSPAKDEGRKATLLGWDAPLPNASSRKSSTIIGLQPVTKDAPKPSEPAQPSTTPSSRRTPVAKAVGDRPPEIPKRASSHMRPPAPDIFVAPKSRTPVPSLLEIAGPNDPVGRGHTLRMRPMPPKPSPAARPPEPILPQPSPAPWPYRRAALVFLGMCALLLAGAGASAALRHKDTRVDPLAGQPLVREERVDMLPATPSAVWSSARPDAPIAAAPQTNANGADFSRDRADAAIADATTNIANCNTSGKPMQTSVRVTFAPTGHVESASVLDRPYSGNAIGRCVSSQLHKATMAPFHGRSQTITTVIVSP